MSNTSSSLFQFQTQTPPTDSGPPSFDSELAPPPVGAIDADQTSLFIDGVDETAGDSVLDAARVVNLSTVNITNIHINTRVYTR